MTIFRLNNTLKMSGGRANGEHLMWERLQERPASVDATGINTQNLHN